MAQSLVVSGLVTKRSELAGRIKALESEIKELAADVKSLDGAIKVIDPSFNLSTIKAKRIFGKNKFFERGEASRFLLDSLREASGPVSTNELTEQARSSKGIAKADAKALQACILTTLSRQRIKGVVVEVGRDETGAIKWELAG
jgi:hypothetical protein